MSPFVSESDRLGALLSRLTVPGQAAFFLAASLALLEHYERWSPVGDRNERLLRGAHRAARGFATTGESKVEEIRALLALIEGEAPEGEGQHESSATAAQDCWICADISLQLAVGRFSASDGIWYFLEPLYQDGTQRLFGVSDVGSEYEQHGETAVLRDPTVAKALRVLESTISSLGRAAVVAPAEVERAVDSLRSICPRPEQT